MTEIIDLLFVLFASAVMGLDVIAVLFLSWIFGVICGMFAMDAKIEPFAWFWVIVFFVIGVGVGYLVIAFGGVVAGAIMDAFDGDHPWSSSVFKFLWVIWFLVFVFSFFGGASFEKERKHI